MIYFFFYNHLFNLDLINKLSPFYTIEEGFVLINNFNKENDILVIDDNSINNNIKLKGKFVSFPMSSLSNIIDKLSKINEIKYKNRESYKLKTINVYFEDIDIDIDIDNTINNNDLVNELNKTHHKEAYIIY
jgi:hypothetical protein